MKTSRIVLAVLITVAVIVLARRFGPNWPYEVSALLAEGTIFTHKAPRGHDGEGPARILLQARARAGEAQKDDLDAELFWKIRGKESWNSLAAAEIVKKAGEGASVFVFEIPHQAPTTRVEYRFEVGYEDEQKPLARPDGSPMMVKFKGIVPSWIVILHVAGMFGGFFLLVLGSLHALRLAAGRDDGGRSKRLAWWAWLVMFLGGVPVGMAMNYYAFDVYWEAFPFGGDVTDNKTQIALILWGLAALALTLKTNRLTGALAAISAALVLAIFLIPHSL